MIAAVTTTITLLAGWLMTITDREGFPTLGSGLWWAVQTVTTVGYTAAVVMLVGIGLVTVITASITGAFVARSRREQHLVGNDVASAEQLRQIDERLARIAAALRDRS